MILFGHTLTVAFTILATPNALMNFQAIFHGSSRNFHIEPATVHRIVEALAWLKSRI